MTNWQIPAVVLATGLMAFPSFAEDEVIDPSDLTKVYTQAAVFVSSDADVRISSMFTGSWSEEISFAGFIEGNFGNKDAGEEDKLGYNYLGGRAQYFQVHEVDIPFFKRVGLSGDVIHNVSPAGYGLDDTLIYSLGLIALIDPKYTFGTMMFPNFAYTSGDVFGESATGYLASFYTTIPLSESGAFLQFWPEYIDVSGDVVEMASTTFNLMVNAPLNAGRTQWLMTKFEYSSSDMTTPTGSEFSINNDLKIEIGMKWFF